MRCRSGGTSRQARLSSPTRWSIIIPAADSIQPHRNERSADRRLRIGYVSPDFRDHVVGRNLLPLFREHDHQRFEILCYADVLCNAASFSCSCRPCGAKVTRLT